MATSDSPKAASKLVSALYGIYSADEVIPATATDPAKRVISWSDPRDSTGATGGEDTVTILTDAQLTDALNQLYGDNPSLLHLAAKAEAFWNAVIQFNNGNTVNSPLWDELLASAFVDSENFLAGIGIQASAPSSLASSGNYGFSDTDDSSSDGGFAPPAVSGRDICRFFLSGNCRYGASCRYFHPSPDSHSLRSSGGSSQSAWSAPDGFHSPSASPYAPQPRQPVVCKYFNTPRGCNNGDNCKFAHISPYGPASTTAKAPVAAVPASPSAPAKQAALHPSPNSIANSSYYKAGSWSDMLDETEDDPDLSEESFGGKDYHTPCQQCGKLPTVSGTGLCGMCCFGKADWAVVSALYSVATSHSGFAGTLPEDKVEEILASVVGDEQLTAEMLAAMAGYLEAEKQLFADIEHYTTAVNDRLSNGGFIGILNEQLPDVPNTQIPSVIEKTRRPTNHNKKVTAVLSKWFQENLENPYPSDAVKAELSMRTGLPLRQLNTWMQNARTRLLPKLHQKMKKSKLGRRKAAEKDSDEGSDLDFDNFDTGDDVEMSESESIKAEPKDEPSSSESAAGAARPVTPMEAMQAVISPTGEVTQTSMKAPPNPIFGKIPAGSANGASKGPAKTPAAAKTRGKSAKKSPVSPPPDPEMLKNLVSTESLEDMDQVLGEEMTNGAQGTPTPVATEDAMDLDSDANQTKSSTKSSVEARYSTRKSQEEAMEVTAPPAAGVQTRTSARRASREKTK